MCHMINLIFLYVKFYVFIWTINSTYRLISDLSNDDLNLRLNLVEDLSKIKKGAEAPFMNL